MKHHLPTSNPIEILLVEDNAGDIRLTQEAFKENKINNNLSVARDGVEALAFLRRQGELCASRQAGFDPSGSEPAAHGWTRGPERIKKRSGIKEDPSRDPDHLQFGTGRDPILQSARQLLHHQTGRSGSVYQRDPIHRRILAFDCQTAPQGRPTAWFLKQ
jgi:hypothetical protein